MFVVKRLYTQTLVSPLLILGLAAVLWLNPTTSRATGIGQVEQFQKMQQQRPADKRFSQFFQQLQQNPKSADAHLGLAKLYSSQNLLELAQTSFRRAIALDNNLAQAHYGLAKVYRKKQLKPLEVYELKQAVAKAPQQDQYRYQLGVVLMEPATYDFKAAKKQYKELQKMNSPLAPKLGQLVE